MSEGMDKRNDIQREIDEAFAFLNVFQVSGDLVDVMATIRMHLCKAYELAAEKEEDHG